MADKKINTALMPQHKRMAVGEKVNTLPAGKPTAKK